MSKVEPVAAAKGKLAQLFEVQIESVQVPEAARRVERAFSTILAAAGRGRSPTVESEDAAADRSGLVGADAEQGEDRAGRVDSADSSVVYSSHDLHIRNESQRCRFRQDPGPPAITAKTSPALSSRRWLKLDPMSQTLEAAYQPLRVLRRGRRTESEPQT